MNKLLFCILAGMSGAALAAGPARTIDVAMDDSMRFTPSQIEVKAGETVRFALRNNGKLEHEFVVGTDAQIAQHAKEMKEHAQAHSHMHHAAPGLNAVTLGPGGTGSLVMTFAKPQVLQVACLVPGHYEAGMKGTINVVR